LGTLDAKKFRKGFPQEAKLSQLLAVSQNISGLMTVTQKELVQLVENNWNQQQLAKLEDRKVLDWSTDQHEEPSMSQKESILSPTDPSKSFINDSSAFYEDLD